MSTEFKGVLETLCGTCEPLAVAGDKLAFAVKKPKDAKLAFDVLMAHGFECNVYKDNEAARLYIRKPTPEQLLALPQALAYARALKDMQQALERLESDKSLKIKEYSLSMTASSQHRQITAHMALEVPKAAASGSPAAPALAMSSGARVSVSPVAADEEYIVDFFEGPEVMRPRGRRKKQQYTNTPDSYGKQLKTFVKGNAAGAISMAIIGIFLLVFAYSLFQVSKGFFCPDFAVADKEKNRAWYCR